MPPPRLRQSTHCCLSDTPEAASVTALDSEYTQRTFHQGSKAASNSQPFLPVKVKIFLKQYLILGRNIISILGAQPSIFFNYPELITWVGFGLIFLDIRSKCILCHIPGISELRSFNPLPVFYQGITLLFFLH